MMNMILAKRPLGPNVVELVVEAPRIAARARAAMRGASTTSSTTFGPRGRFARIMFIIVHLPGVDP